VGVTDAAHHQRANTERIAAGDHPLGRHADQRVGAFDHPQRVDETIEQRGEPARRDKVDDDLGVGGRLEDRSLTDKFAAQVHRVRNVAVVSDSETARGKVGEQRLNIAEARAARSRVAHVTCRHRARQLAQRGSAREVLRDVTDPAARVELLAVEAGDPDRLLSAVLQGVETESDDRRGVSRADDAEHAAFLAQLVAVIERISEVHGSAGLAATTGAERWAVSHVEGKPPRGKGGSCRCRRLWPERITARADLRGGARRLSPTDECLHCPAPSHALKRARTPARGAHCLILSPFEWTIAKRYMLPGRGEAFIALVAGISLAAVMLGVAALVIVMSVMNGFRAELLDKIVGLNGHAIIQAYGGRLPDWEQVLAEVEETPGVVRASPLIEQPLLVNFNGRVEAILVRGNTAEDIRRLEDKRVAGTLATLRAGSGQVAIGSRLAENLGARLGDTITIINPQGRATPFGTVPREIGYRVAAIFEIGVFDYDEAYVVMPIADAQTLLLLGDTIGLIEVKTTDPDTVSETLAPLKRRLAGRAVISDWKTINASLFEALAVERVAMFIVLSIIVLVAVFNILSSLIMLVRAKTRDIAILRTMGATRRSLLKIFVTTGFVIGALGTVAGLLLGFVFLFFRQPIVRAIELMTGQNLWDPSIRFLTELPSRTDPVEVTVICVMALAFSFLATLYPSFKAASTDPVQVLRYE
jgi:lipoprotein-releasing system permease protein